MLYQQLLLHLSTENSRGTPPPPPFFPIGQELHNLLENLIGDADGLGLSD